MSDIDIKNKIHELETQINKLSKEYKLKLEVDIYEKGNISEVSFDTINIKVFRRL